MNLKTIFLYIFSSNIVVAATSIITGLLTAKFLGVEDRGTYYLFVQLIAVGSVVLSFGVAQSLQFHIRSNELTREDGLKIAIFLSAGLTVIFTGVLALFTKNFLDVNYYIVSALITLLLIANLYLSAIMMTDQCGVELVSRYNIFSALATLFSMALFIYMGGLTIFYSLAAMLLGQFVKLIFCLWFLKELIVNSLRNIYTKSFTSSFAKYSISALVFAGTFAFFSKSDMALAAKMLSTSELGAYSMVLAFAEAPILIGAALGTAMFAKLPAEDDSVVYKTTIKLACALAPVSLALCGFIYLVIKSGLSILIGPEYYLVHTMFLQAIPGIVSVVLGYIFANFHAVRAEQNINSIVFSLGLLVKVLSLYFFNLILPDDWRSVIWSFNSGGIFICASFLATFIAFCRRESNRVNG